MDLRIEKTYRSLLSAFTRLLETHRYEEVTVAMLCDEAMIRRTTFYKHFADKAEFFSFFVDSLRLELLKKGEEQAENERAQRGDAEPEEPVEDEEGLAILGNLVAFLLEHEALVDNIFASSMTGMMMLMMEDKVAETLRKRYRETYSARGDTAVTLAAASEFAAGGIVCLLEKWWTRGHSEEGETELIRMANTLVVRVFALA